MRYSDTLYQHFRDSQRVGQLPADQPGYGSARVGEVRHGGVIELSLQVDPSHQQVADARFKAYGCGATIAAAAWVCTWLPGRCIEQVESIDAEIISRGLTLPPNKVQCAVLAASAVRAALANYRDHCDPSKQPTY